MSKCKWCKVDPAVTKSGYCRDCDQMIREDILAKRDRLKILADIASPTLPDEKKKHILDEVRTLKGDLAVYKDAHVPFFKSSISDWVNPVLSRLGITVEEYKGIQADAAGITCEKCGSKNIRLVDINKKTGRGASFWILWGVLTLFSCGIALLVLPFFAATPVTEESRTDAVCNDCGHRWTI